MVKASEIPDILATMPGFEEVRKQNGASWVMFRGKWIRCYFGSIHGFTDFHNTGISYFTKENTHRDYSYRLKIGIL